MATVTGFTAARMQQIEDSTVVSGFVDPQGRLLLGTRDGTEIDAGPVTGAPGPTGTGPTGTIAMFAGLVAPEGHLLCEGQAVSRTAYSTLFSIIGTLYGAGDGLTTFNVPNLKGRVIVGKDAAQTEFDTLGEAGGAKTHILSASEMPSHTHVQNAHNHTQDAHNHTQNSHNHTQNSHTHTINQPGSLGGPDQGIWADYAGGGATNVHVAQRVANTSAWANRLGNAGTTATNIAATATNIAATATNQAATATNQNTGGGAAHNNLQPYMVLNYIIKT